MKKTVRSVKSIHKIIPIILFECDCAETTALVDIPDADCPIDLKQIQRVFVQRAGTPFNATGDPSSDILDLADWQVLKVATDSTKIVATPLIGGDPIIEAGEAITNGGNDNSTLNGVEEVEGTSPSLFTAVFKSMSSAQEKALKALICEKNLVVYFALQGGRIAAVSKTTGVYNGFPIQAQFLSDRNNAGFGTKDTHNFRFSLEAGWSENLVIVKPNFNPLTDI